MQTSMAVSQIPVTNNPVIPRANYTIPGQPPHHITGPTNVVPGTGYPIPGPSGTTVYFPQGAVFPPWNM